MSVKEKPKTAREAKEIVDRLLHGKHEWGCRIKGPRPGEAMETAYPGINAAWEAQREYELLLDAERLGVTENPEGQIEYRV
jgi:hypothetical protein